MLTGEVEVSREQEFTPKMKCGHCGNSAPMEVVARHSQVQDNHDPVSGFQWEAGPYYQMARCPACSGVTLRRCFYHDGDDPGELEWAVLFPAGPKTPRGLPADINRALVAAERVRPIDSNAYAVLLRRVLELVCADRQASGKTLNEMLADLAKKGEVPDKLVAVAKSLRRLGNLGAHAGLGEVTPAEAPILEDLIRAVLEYVYSAPYLAAQAEERLQTLQAKGDAGGAEVTTESAQGN